MQLKKIIPTLITLLSIPIVSAYWGGYYNSPLEYLDNEWVRFVAIFLILFAVIYFAMSKSFKGDRGVATVVAGGLTLLITISLSQRGLLYSYAGDELGTWITLGAGLIALGFIAKIAFENFGKIGAITFAVLFWFLLNYINPYEYLNYAPTIILDIHGFFSNILGLIIFIILAIIFSSMAEGKSPGEKIIQGIGKFFKK